MGRWLKSMPRGPFHSCRRLSIHRWRFAPGTLWTLPLTVTSNTFSSDGIGSGSRIFPGELPYLLSVERVQFLAVRYRPLSAAVVSKLKARVLLTYLVLELRWRTIPRLDVAPKFRIRNLYEFYLRCNSDGCAPRFEAIKPHDEETRGHGVKVQVPLHETPIGPPPHTLGFVRKRLNHRAGAT
jgi:hypothetical protein